MERAADDEERTQGTTGSAPAAAGLGRRDFLTRGAGVGLALGLPPLLAGCNGGDGDRWRGAVPLAGLSPPSSGKHTRTLFFNLSHESHAGKTYYLTGGGRRYPLTPVALQPDVLLRARERNAFLRAVADNQITHHVENAQFANDSVTLCYVSADIDVQTGTWSMSSTQLYIPPAGATVAYANARMLQPSGPLPLSAKRRRYGVAAAQSAQDLSDERELLDATSHAATLVGCYPDLMSLEPNASHTIHSNHVDRSEGVVNLSELLQRPQYGAALPQKTTGKTNETGWGTLQPVLNDFGVAIHNLSGQHAGRIQYQPQLHPDLLPSAASAMTGVVPEVKDDIALGADATALIPAPSEAGNAVLKGAMWLRHDGLTQIDQSSGKPTDPNFRMVLKQQNGQRGYIVKATSSPNGTGVKLSLTLLNFFLEFRGIWLQFLDVNGAVLQLKSIPEYNRDGIVSQHDKSQDTDTAMFLSMIGPVFTILAIPAVPAFAQPSFNVPQAAHTVRVLSSTLSYQGGNSYPDTVVPGAVMTGLCSYGLTALLAAAGAGPVVPAICKDVIIPLLQTLTLEFMTAVDNALNPNGDHSIAGQMSTPNFWIGQALVAGKVLVTIAFSLGRRALVEAIAAAITTGVAEDSVPVAGEIMLAISVAIGGITMAETTADLALTPWTYVDDLVFTHDLAVTLVPASGTFPADATSYTVTAMFDDGTPYSATLPLQGPVKPVVFTGVPLGGMVNITAAFVQDAIFPGQPDILVGKGTTGPIPNDTTPGRQITIEEIKFEIKSNTLYQHKQKTSLDLNGRHLWSAGPAPTVNEATSVCGNAGTVCGFRGISVRQAAGSSVPGYLGYAWQSQNTDGSKAPGCVGGGVGQLDQMANLNTDPTNAQGGYVNGPCGIGLPGVRVAYSLLSHGSSNFYLDTSNASNVSPLIVRQVTLEPHPVFTSPLSNEAWGVLNNPSDALLLHPAGHLVSINTANHTIETLRIPLVAKTDAEAAVQLLAQIKCGRGSRPGLIDTPVAAAVGPNGVILVLEAGNNRIQAFDLGCNPVRHFNKQTGPNSSPYSLRLGATDPDKGWQYLDLAVEYTGFLYVLSYKQTSFAYRLDIYHPDQADSNPIATTPNVNAARLTVDFWRSVYTLNYEVLQLPGGAPAGLTEPSVSLWTPCDVGQTC